MIEELTKKDLVRMEKPGAKEVVQEVKTTDDPSIHRIHTLDAEKQLSKKSSHFALSRHQ